MKIKNYRFNMEGYELVDKAMNVGYRMLLGEEITYEPNDSDKVEDMVFIPDPTQSEMELANDLLEYFIEEEEYEKCANIRDIINLKKTINRLYEQE
tara:strand:+ start:546 stop:833 length:288 start_codon:yes stop_codon:yes gene_type:complete